MFGRAGIRPSAQVALSLPAPLQPHVRLVILIAFAVFVCEMLIMFILTYLPGLPAWFYALLNTILLVVLLSSLLYFGLFCTLTQYVSELRRAENTIREQRDNLDKRSWHVRPNSTRSMPCSSGKSLNASEPMISLNGNWL
jgi:hypothetical protein